MTKTLNAKHFSKYSGIEVLRSLGIASIILLCFAPIAALLFTALGPSDSEWTHIAKYSLPGYIRQTLSLLLLTTLGTFFWGTSTAWLVSTCKFPGHSFFRWSLALPMTIPSYILAFIYTDAFEYAGYVQRFLRSVFGWNSPADYYFPPIRSVWGAALVLTLAFYPYVFLAARTAFLQRIYAYMEAGRALGANPYKLFFRISLPMAYPFLVVGVILVAFETLNTFGLVQLMGVRTISIGIFNTWVINRSPVGAARIALIGVSFIFLLIALERHLRSAGRSINAKGRNNMRPFYQLRGAKAVLAWLTCSIPFLMAFIFPLAVLLYYGIFYAHRSFSPQLFTFAGNSLLLGVLGALTTLAITISLFALLGRRARKGKLLQFSRLSTLGYAFPGTLIAVGTMQAFGQLPFLLIGTIFALVFALSIRFQMLSFGFLESGLSEISPRYDEGVRILGKSEWVLFSRIHFPLLRRSILAAALMTCIEIMQELPITLILRPFNFETLASFVFQYASTERYAESAIGSLMLIAVGQIPVIFLSKSLEKGDQS